MRSLAPIVLSSLLLSSVPLLLAAVLHQPHVVVPQAQAKSSYESAYTFEQTWNAAMRLVRVDLGYKIVERDERAGYILFEYVDKQSTASGSFELLRTERGVRVLCQIPRFPSYHEAVLLERLGRKLKDDYGVPADRNVPIVDDAGPDAGSDTGN